MNRAPVADVAADLSAYLEQCQSEGPVVITQDGKAVAVLLAPWDEQDLERLLLSRSSRFQALLDQSRQSIRAGKGLTADEFWSAVEQQSRIKDNGAAE